MESFRKSLLCKGIRGMVLVIPWWVPEMGIVSRPVLEVVEGAVVVWNRKQMSTVTESPIKAGVGSAKRAKDEGISRLQGCF